MKTFQILLLLLGSLTLSEAKVYLDVINNSEFSIDHKIEKRNNSPKTQNKPNWNSHIGMGVGYLPFLYDQFDPTSGLYDQGPVFNEVMNSAFVNIIYRNLIMLENRLAIQHRFGRYHSYYATYYNHTYLGLNLIPLITKNKVSHSFFVKFGLGVTSNCTCGDDVPYSRPGMFSRSIQIDYYKPLNDLLNLHVSIANNNIISDVPGKYNFTEWQVGVALRLM